MQDHPGAPGTARQEHTRTIVSTNDGGVATQPRAPGHERPRAALRAAQHGRLSAASTAPGADVPPATTAGAPGQHRLRAALQAPGHERPHAASSDAARHGRPSAATRAPGADVPPATAAGAPGQHRLRAAQRAPDHSRSRPAPTAPGHGRPLAASSDAVGHDRPCATLRAPGADVPPATAAGAPGQHRLRAVAIATVALPAGSHRLRQVILPRTPATPNTLTYPHTHRDTAHTLTTHSHQINRHSRASGNPRPPVATGGPQGGQIISPAPSLRRKPQSTNRTAAGRRLAPSPGACSGGGLGKGRLPAHPTINQVHPAIQVLPHPRSCSTAATGFLHHLSRAPPPPCASLRQKPQSSRTNE